MNSVVYRDKSYKSRLLVPVGTDGDRTLCIEVVNWEPRDGVHLCVNKYFIPNQILEEHYRREEV